MDGSQNWVWLSTELRRLFDIGLSDLIFECQHICTCTARALWVLDWFRKPKLSFSLDSSIVEIDQTCLVSRLIDFVLYIPVDCASACLGCWDLCCVGLLSVVYSAIFSSIQCAILGACFLRKITQNSFSSNIPAAVILPSSAKAQLQLNWAEA